MLKTRLLCTALLMATCAFSVETKSWSHGGNQADFEKGTLKNLSLRSDGRLTLAPVFRELHDASSAYLWSLAVDSKGNLYTGGGSPAASTTKLVMLTPAGKAKMLAELPGLQIQSIAVDKKDRIYAATAPDGKVYRVTGEGKSEVFYDPKAKYVWALAFASTGDLFVATGDQGEVHRVTPDGKGSVFFKTEETHARSLAVDAKDNLVVGTEPGGLVLRISPKGEGFVLYQAAKREVTAVAVSADGMIYAAAAGNKAPAPVSGQLLTGPIPVSTAAPPAPSGGGPSPTTRPQIPPPASTSPAASPLSGGSEVYRIGADGFPQRIWSHPQDVVYAIGLDANGKPVVGTGNKGNIYRIDSELISTLLVDAAPTQVTAFTTGPKGRLYAATGNVGKVYQIGPELEKEGSYESEPLDGTFFSYWGRVRYKVDLHGGTLRLETRSGNLDRPQKNWSPWAPVDPQTARITSPSARFLQYRLTLGAAADSGSPDLRELVIAYMPKNVAPAIEEVEITPANYKFPPATTPTTPNPATISLPPLGQRRRLVSSLSMDGSSASQTMQYAKGVSGVRWSVSDPNGDELTYKVEIRGLQEREWKLLKEKVKEKYLSWDSTAFPDGDYVARVTATDSPDNPVDQALSTQLESERFTIDNTPPQISSLAATRSGNSVAVRWRARDEKSTIALAEYSVNGGDWVVVQPTTRLSDAPEHEYSLTVDAAGAEQTVAVRVTDEFDNQSVDKVISR